MMIRFSFPILALLPAAFSGCATTKHSQSQVDAQTRWSEVRGQVKLQLAHQQYAAGLTRECEGSLADAMELNPDDCTALSLLARVHIEEDRLASAQASIEAARAQGGSAPDLTYLEGVILEQRGELEPALIKFSEACEANLASIDYLTARVETLVTLGRTPEAGAILARYAGGTDDRTSAAVLAGRVAMLQGNRREAAAWFGKAMDAAGDDPVISEEYGLLLTEMARYEEALALLQPLIEDRDADEAKPSVVHAVARCQLGLRHPAEARDILAGFVKDNQEDSCGQLLLAKAAVASGDVAVALSALEMARKHDPSNREIMFVQAVIDRARGRNSEAQRGLRAILEQSPADVDAHCLLGEILAKHGDHQAARQQFKMALTIDPSCAWASSSLPALVAASPADPITLARSDASSEKVKPNRQMAAQ